ncbi:hypothetical protein [Parvibaculum sp.]|uniref:hypothetical protein n=1 Tax=Parvibaculum sp. TaxID=2024848 RepID=UPI001AFFA381|nr:hypothetical protein [Parvibaculum sp.]MBO6633146.1 hypothetical protein [Parvibaculum sp.]MBO6679618.1 hypothetical protein [Parvibaculum sp.]MBO6684874.1 hypothetical protein [Parvibaculum sp.]MBO6905079.1 hypothetical protein [Parvibaculum sp.]
MIRSAFLSLALLLPLAGCGDAGPEADASRAAAVFYDIVLSERSGGVPGEDLRARLRPVISPDLDSLIAQAAEAERRHAERTNNSEPPYLQGDIFSSLFEGPTAYEIGPCERKEEDGATFTRCEVMLVHEGDDPVQWKDRVILSANGGPDERRWLVDDIQYGGDWDFAMKGSLKESLRAVIAEEE